MMMSDDFGEDSFGAKAARERINEQLQEMVDSHNILAFIKVRRARLWTIRFHRQSYETLRPRGL